jgi:hypothetical protein
MRYRTLTTVLLGLFVATALNGCTRAPDLVPLTSPGQPGNPTGFCKSVGNSTKVVVTVKNQTADDAPATVTTVKFSTGAEVKVPTPAIPGNGSVELPPIDIPAGCFSPDCSFSITVDSNNQINETNETNNGTTGTCIG